MNSTIFPLLLGVWTSMLKIIQSKAFYDGQLGQQEKFKYEIPPRKHIIMYRTFSLGTDYF